MKKMLIAALAVLLFSCGQEKKPVVIPDNVLPKEKMALVITDIHIAEAEANMKTLPDSLSNEKPGFQKIFEKNKVTKAQYDTSLSFYIEHPELLDTIYVQVLNELSKKQGHTAGQ